MRGVDVHQHIWPPELIDALRARSSPPRLRGWTLELRGEPPHETDPASHDPALRAELVEQDGIDRALISLSTALGIEALPPDQARALLDAYHEGALRLPNCFGAWASASLTDVDPGALGRELDRGFIGLTLPATALLDPSGFDRVRPLLELLEDRSAPIFIHPGPPTATPAMNARAGWWSALVPYVQQMHAAWFAFRLIGRPRHPDLRVLFAMLAGLAPLHGERFTARAHRPLVLDENLFLDASSYGPRAVDAVIRAMGVGVLIGGSDRPYAEPQPVDLGAGVDEALFEHNPRRLLALGKEVRLDAVPIAAAP